MQMTNEEIVVRYRQAKLKGVQVKILAELNDCPVEKIIGILVANGFDSRNFNHLRKELRIKAENKQEEKKIPYKKPEIIKEPPKKEVEPEEPAKEPIPVEKAIAALYERVVELNNQKALIDEELADINVHLNRIEDFIAGRSDNNGSNAVSESCCGCN